MATNGKTDPRPLPAPTRQRNERLDLLRGYFIAIMIVNHLFLAGNDWMRPITGLNQLWVSAAAGFVLVSGALLGTIYPDRLRRDGLGPAMRKALRRSVQLYLITVIGHIVLASVDLLLHHAYGLPTSVPTNYFKLVEGAVLQNGYAFRYLDLLPLYAVLLPLGVLAVHAFQRGYLRWVLLGSVVLWYMRATDPRAMRVFALGFQPGSWQIIYLAGIVSGLFREQIGDWCRDHRTLRSVSFPVLLLVAGTILYVSYQVAFNGWFADTDWLQASSVVFTKSTVGVGRACAAILVMAALYAVATVWWRPLRKVLGWLLLPLGRNALTSYVIQGVLSFCVLRLPGWPFEAWSSPAKALFALGSVLLVWVLTKLFVAAHGRLRTRSSHPHVAVRTESPGGRTRGSMDAS